MPQTLMPAPPRERAVEAPPVDPFLGWNPFGLAWPRWIEEFLPRAAGNGDALLAPAMDVVTEDDALRLTLELPGIRKEDVHVEVKDGVLSVSGEKKSETSKKTRNVQRLERRFGSFFRSVALPSGIDPNTAEAEFKDGVLSIRIPMREEAKPHALKIK
jgi:HSP20 family protein